ncbi:hypothetical protein [Desulfohalovibrio reitneri]|uniref:hypothetical protein n=1 Tax=Desulfohalovibrio reitneri TaxID=1307759 RepID=UPI0004A6C991|nr:hypothetical protein [Desulfohalovibrio reitneri]
MSDVKDLLTDTAREIRDLEADAGKLAAVGDLQGHRQALRKKAELLTSLPSRLDGLVEKLPAPERQRVREAVVSMAKRGKAALDVDSPFFMRQLLYADDQTDHEPNELETLAAKLQA